MIRTKNVQFSYHSTQKFTFPDFECKANQSLLIVGESGTGKTTLLHLLAGLLQVSSGSIWIDKQEFSKFFGTQQDQFRGQNIGIVFQKSHFVSALSVRDNLILAQTLSGKKKNLQRIKDLLAHLGLSSKLDVKTNRLSIGEQQRIAIARALLHFPKVILADEPTSGLDDKNCHQVISLLENQARQTQSSLVIVTHDGRLQEHFSEKIKL